MKKNKLNHVNIGIQVLFRHIKHCSLIFNHKFCINLKKTIYMMSILIRFDLNHFNLNKMSFYIRITSYKGAISVEIVEGWLILYL